MRKLLLLFPVLLFLQAASSDERATTVGFMNSADVHTKITSQADLDGVYALASSFEQLKPYVLSGDPCGSSWPWLLCFGDPPRVTYLNLSVYGLTGNLPDFSKMDALQMIYLPNNKLDGPIPDFLGNLPRLRYLDLSNNQFSGEVPQSITSNKNLSYYSVSGNPYLNPPQPRNTTYGLVVRLAIGISVVITIKVLVIACVVSSRRRRQQQQQLQAALCQGQVMAYVPGVTPSGQHSLGVGSVPSNTQPNCRPSNSGEHLSVSGENFPTASLSNGGMNQSNAAAYAVHSIHEAEIAELIRQRSASIRS